MAPPRRQWLNSATIAIDPDDGAMLVDITAPTSFTGGSMAPAQAGVAEPLVAEPTPCRFVWIASPIDNDATYINTKPIFLGDSGGQNMPLTPPNYRGVVIRIDDASKIHVRSVVAGEGVVLSHHQRRTVGGHHLTSRRGTPRGQESSAIFRAPFPAPPGSSAPGSPGIAREEKRVNAMIGMKINHLFFDQPAVVRATDRATRRVFSRFGAFVRRSARSSIRPRKRVSAPGQPPTSRTGLLKRFLFFGFNPSKRSVVIGPARLNGSGRGDAPSLLEHGGTTTLRRRGQRHRVRIRSRPYMGPAFEKEQPKLSVMWRDSVH